MGCRNLTKNYRLILKPLEKLQIQKKGSLTIEFVELDYTLDEEFKPGLYLQIKKFLESDYNDMCTVQEQLNNYEIYAKIASYND